MLIRVFLVALAMVLPPSAQAAWAPFTTAKAVVPVSSYQGPGNVQSGALVWVGTRAYSGASAAGHGKIANVVRASDSHSCDFLAATNGSVGNTANCSSGGDNGQSALTWATRSTVSGSMTNPNNGRPTGGGGGNEPGTNVLVTSGDPCAAQVGDQVISAGISQSIWANARPITIMAVTSCSGGVGSYVLSQYFLFSSQTVTDLIPTTVATAFDQSGANACGGSACDLTQGTAANQPYWRWACLGGQPCFDFETATTALSRSSSPSHAQPFTQSAVWNKNAHGAHNFGSLLVSDSAGNWTTAFVYWGTGHAVPQMGMESDPTATWLGPYYGYAPSSWTFTQAVFNEVPTTGQSVLNFSGVAMPLTRGHVGTGALANSLWLGNDSFGKNPVGQISEAGYWPGAWSSAQQTALYNNQVNWYGIPYSYTWNPNHWTWNNGGPWYADSNQWGAIWQEYLSDGSNHCSQYSHYKRRRPSRIDPGRGL